MAGSPHLAYDPQILPAPRPIGNTIVSKSTSHNAGMKVVSGNYETLSEQKRVRVGHSPMARKDHHEVGRVPAEPRTLTPI